MPDKSAVNEYSVIEHKLLLLYLLDKMDIPMSNNQISQFALEGSYMDYFTLQQSLSEMVDVGYLEKTQDNNNTRYTLTDEGITSLEYFVERIPHSTKIRINQYVIDNRKQIKKDFEITANYFYDHVNNDYTVKCGVYEDKSMLMEVNLTVVTKEQARNICNNWKRDINELYGSILSQLAGTTKFEPELIETD